MPREGTGAQVTDVATGGATWREDTAQSLSTRDWSDLGRQQFRPACDKEAPPQTHFVFRFACV
jgi:hypothetical protein